MASKRPRIPSDSSSDSSVSPPSSPITKSSRTSASGGGEHQLLCNLPPTCNQRPTYLANTKDLESHYATFHAHVCEQRGCSCVFPDARFLELHQTECHDPLAAVRKDRGEKIFACFLASCPKRFSNPKARRLHLIQAHAYPKEYFFAVTNKGVGGLLKKWGEGASMIRGEWKKREEDAQNTQRDDGRSEESESNISDHLVDDTSDGNESDATERQSANGYATKIERTLTLPSNQNGDGRSASTRDTEMADADKLAESMSSLSLVPGSIRFGRGAAKVGFSHGYNVGNIPRGRGRGGRGRARGFSIQPHADAHHTLGGAGLEGSGMELDNTTTGPHYNRGRGMYRGRVGPAMIQGIAVSGRGSTPARRGPRGGLGRGRGII